NLFLHPIIKNETFIIFYRNIYFNFIFHISSQKAGQWPVVITIGCTAGSLTACRLRTFVM
ncbi:MAG: hypothetical protein K5829_12210, partial [Treponema sp.]|nr:hypothetical protein [Treponema sp.]